MCCNKQSPLLMLLQIKISIHDVKAFKSVNAYSGHENRFHGLGFVYNSDVLDDVCMHKT